MWSYLHLCRSRSYNVGCTRRVFLATIHTLCLWHVQNIFMSFLNELYARFAEEDFKTRFQSIVHNQLTPFDFEAAWAMMLNEFNLHEESYMIFERIGYLPFPNMIFVG
jgi:hypothetical protein